MVTPEPDNRCPQQGWGAPGSGNSSQSDPAVPGEVSRCRFRVRALNSRRELTPDFRTNSLNAPVPDVCIFLLLPSRSARGVTDPQLPKRSPCAPTAPPHPSGPPSTDPSPSQSTESN